MANMLAKIADKSCCGRCGGTPGNKASRRAHRTPERRQWKAELAADEMTGYDAEEQAFQARIKATGMTEDQYFCALEDNDGEYRG